MTDLTAYIHAFDTCAIALAYPFADFTTAVSMVQFIAVWGIVTPTTCLGRDISFHFAGWADPGVGFVACPGLNAVEVVDVVAIIAIPHWVIMDDFIGAYCAFISTIYQSQP